MCLLFFFILLFHFCIFTAHRRGARFALWRSSALILFSSAITPNSLFYCMENNCLYNWRLNRLPLLAANQQPLCDGRLRKRQALPLSAGLWPDIVEKGSLTHAAKTDRRYYNVFVKPNAEGKSRSVCTMLRRENDL